MAINQEGIECPHCKYVQKLLKVISPADAGKYLKEQCFECQKEFWYAYDIDRDGKRLYFSFQENPEKVIPETETSTHKINPSEEISVRKRWKRFIDAIEKIIESGHHYLIVHNVKYAEDYLSTWTSMPGCKGVKLTSLVPKENIFVLDYEGFFKCGKETS